ncbi:hypothetical protein [Desulfonatronovibrio hydrogenovorans]|uniref:hypothetical protein n=1 Tax=Desulfonatronovibrio hydrogenovorans TaxID=53245 RepID=UPI00048BD31F|nr:hypothetical protein [Desulfonatronovibrio hydrogenovorans]
MHISERRAGLILALVTGLLILAVGVRPGQAREPFFAPVPPMEVYDFPRAAEQIKLRGLLISEDVYRAVVYIQNQRNFKVVQPMDFIEVTIDDLRHEFRVTGMGGRRLVLSGADSFRYEIGVEQRD